MLVARAKLLDGSISRTLETRRRLLVRLLLDLVEDLAMLANAADDPVDFPGRLVLGRRNRAKAA